MKLSVMVITFNHEPYIAQALESILAQRVNFDFEIVVGEDCSTDRTRDILMGFYHQYPTRIVPLIRDRNLGMMRNLEQTLSACRGEYIAIIEGDDYWTCVDKLEKQVDFLDAHAEYSICCHKARILNEIGGEHILEESGAAKDGVFPSRHAGTYTIEDLLVQNFIMTCTVMYRKRAVGDLPSWFIEQHLGDWPLCALAARSGQIYLMNEVMAIYRVHAGGVWSSQTSMRQLHACTQMLRVVDKHLDFKYHDIIRKTIAQFHLYPASLARKKGNRCETARRLLDFIRKTGWQLRDTPPEFRALAEYVFLGSWQGMSITSQLIQRALSKFGYKLVRVQSATNSSRLKIKRI